MQRDEDPPRGAQAAEPGPSTILASFQLSGDSESQITAFIESLSQGLSGPKFRKLLTYVLNLLNLIGRSMNSSELSNHVYLTKQIPHGMS